MTTTPRQQATAIRAAWPHQTDETGDRAALAMVIAAGRNGADSATMTRALLACWQQLSHRSLSQRSTLVHELRTAVRNGETTDRAWQAIALGETDAELIGAGVTGYLGGMPCSVDRRARALDDVLHWFRRGLALDRVAVFVALLRQGDAVINEQLAGLQGRLSDGERARVLREIADTTDSTTRQFMLDWQA